MDPIVAEIIKYAPMFIAGFGLAYIWYSGEQEE